MKKLLCSAALVSAVVCTSAISAMAAPAIFSISGGTSYTLGSGGGPGNTFPFSPEGTALAASGIGNGTVITTFDTANAGGGGLFISPQVVTLTFTYEGQSAAFINQAQDSFSFNGGNPFFVTRPLATATPLNTSFSSAFNVGANPGLVPFLFRSECFGTCNSPPAAHDAINGGPVDSHTSIGFFIPASAPNTVFAFFEDSLLSPGLVDYNDMVVEITAVSGTGVTPLPAALTLFAGGLGLLGFAGMRRRKKAEARALSSVEALA